MFWRSIIEKQTHRYLSIITLLRKRSYSLEELADEIEINEKTMRRYLTNLNKKYHLSITIKKKKQVVWQDSREYLVGCQNILRESNWFILFCNALRQEPFMRKGHALRQLNRFLVPFNLWINYSRQCIDGPVAMLVELELRYMKDFSVCYRSEDFLENWQQLNVPPIAKKEAELWLQAIPDRASLTNFITHWQLPSKLGCLLYFKYQMIEATRRRQFYESHKKQATFLYCAASRVASILMRTMQLESVFSEMMRQRFFYLLLELWLGMPAAYFGYEQCPLKNLDYLMIASRKIKSELNFLYNCPTKDLALALYSILKKVYPISLVKPAFSLGLKIDATYEESYQLCLRLNQTIQMNHPVAFYPATDTSSFDYDLLIIEGTPSVFDKSKKVIYLEDFSFEELIELAAHYFPRNKKGETVFTIP